MTPTHVCDECRSNGPWAKCKCRDKRGGGRGKVTEYNHDEIGQTPHTPTLAELEDLFRAVE